MLDLVIFDVAGTTVADPNLVGAAFRGALALEGVTVDDATLASVMGTPKPVAIETILREAGSESNPNVVHDRFVELMIETYRTHPAVAPIAGIDDLLDDLKAAGVKVALDTGFGRRILDVVLERCGWSEGRFDATVASDEVAFGRPAPDLAIEAMRRCGVVDPARVAKVGDTPADLGEGLAAQCGINVGVTYGTHHRESLEAYPHTDIVDDIDQLREALGVVLRCGG